MDPSAVFLIGYRASGKTTVGRRLAESLERPFRDTDSILETQLGCSIAEFFAREGEVAFRRRESDVLQEVIAEAKGLPLVVSTGGGIILDPENVASMRAAGTVVWLAADVGSLERRIAADPASATARPPLTGGSSASEVRDVLAVRDPLYRAAAHRTIQTEGKSLAAIAREIAEGLEKPSG